MSDNRKRGIEYDWKEKSMGKNSDCHSVSDRCNMGGISDFMDGIEFIQTKCGNFCMATHMNF